MAVRRSRSKKKSAKRSPKLSAPGVPNVPQMRLHKGSGQGYVYFQGRSHYMGVCGSPECRDAYADFVEDVIRFGGIQPDEDQRRSVAALSLAYSKFSRVYYRHADGTPTTEVGNVRLAIRRWRVRFGHLRVDEIGPRHLKRFQADLVAEGFARKTINSTVGRVRRMFRWGVAEELCPPAVLHALTAVPDLRAGRSDAHETDPVKPVPREHVDAVLPLLSPTLRAFIEVGWWTGARPGELCAMRVGEVDRSSDPWTYSPGQHKTLHRGRTREVLLGPNAQRALSPLLLRSDDSFAFDPRESMKWSLEQKAAKRKTPLSCGNRPGTNRVKSPKREPGEHFGVDAVNRAIRRACEKAGVPPWSAGRLRHSCATRLRRECGLEVASLQLGHSSALVTGAVYAQADQDRLKSAMREVG